MKQELLSEQEIQEHLITLRLAYDPGSPFRGMINFNDGLLSLPVHQQWQVRKAMPEDLVKMVFGDESESEA